jgi:hypothetical protein
MDQMIKYRQNRIKVLIKLNILNKISNEDFKKEFEKINNELYILSRLN